MLLVSTAAAFLHVPTVLPLKCEQFILIISGFLECMCMMETSMPMRKSTVSPSGPSQFTTGGKFTMEAEVEFISTVFKYKLRVQMGTKALSKLTVITWPQAEGCNAVL